MADRLRPAVVQNQITSARKIRLVDFATGGADLQPEHRKWLEDTLGFLRSHTNFWVYIYGFASKLGRKGSHDAKEARTFNVGLSYERASSVARFLEGRDPRISGRIREFSARGSDSYNAPPDDDSAEQRAAEVHVYLAATVPAPPPNVEPAPKLPGGRRYSLWEVATPGGVSASPLPLIPATVAANVVVFRSLEQGNATHAYIVPAGGPGISYAGPKLSKIKELVKALFGKMSYTGMSFTKVTATTPFNFGDLDGATCNIEQLGGGVGPGYVFARLSVNGQVWFFGGDGKPFFARRDLVQNAKVSSGGLMVGVGGSGVGGPMVRID